MVHGPEEEELQEWHEEEERDDERREDEEDEFVETFDDANDNPYDEPTGD